MKKLLIGMLLLAVFMLNGESKYITEITDQNFEKEVVQSEEAVLVDFWAPWCGPCKQLGPIIEEIAEEHHLEMKFGKLNVDNNRRTAGGYGIRSIPTVGIFVGGKPVDGFVGLRDKDQMLDILKKHFKSGKTTEKTIEKQ